MKLRVGFNLRTTVSLALLLPCIAMDQGSVILDRERVMRNRERKDGNKQLFKVQEVMCKQRLEKCREKTSVSVAWLLSRAESLVDHHHDDAINSISAVASSIHASTLFDGFHPVIERKEILKTISTLSELRYSLSSLPNSFPVENFDDAIASCRRAVVQLNEMFSGRFESIEVFVTGVLDLLSLDDHGKETINVERRVGLIRATSHFLSAFIGSVTTQIGLSDPLSPCHDQELTCEINLLISRTISFVYPEIADEAGVMMA